MKKFLAAGLGIGAFAFLSGATAWAQVSDEWNSFYVYFTRDYPNSERCYGYSFMVRSDGSYTADPCTLTFEEDDRPRRQEKGEITPLELKALNQVADGIVAENVLYDLGCEDTGGVNLGEYSLMVTLSGERPASEERVQLEYVGVGTNFTCSRGPESNLDELRSLMNVLIERYVPGWADEP